MVDGLGGRMILTIDDDPCWAGQPPLAVVPDPLAVWYRVLDGGGGQRIGCAARRTTQQYAENGDGVQL